DEVATIVGDIGADTCKFGYGGEDSPKHVFSSTAGYLPADAAIKVRHVDGARRDMAQPGELLSTLEPKTGPQKPNPPRGTSGVARRVGNSQSRRREPKRLVRGTLSCCRNDGNLEPDSSPLVDGLLSDWDQVEKLWEHAFQARLRAVASERPVLVAEASWSTAKERRGLMELMFEKFGVPAMFPAKNAMLSAFSAGRATALVCDCGHGATSAVPVVDGFVLNRAVQRGIRGGDWLTKQCSAHLAARGIQVPPRYALQRRGAASGGSPSNEAAAVAAANGKGKGKGKSGAAAAVYQDPFPGTTPSYANHMRMEIVRELKETCMSIPLDESGSSSDEEEERETKYTLPDGTEIQLTDELRHIPEMLMESSAMTPLHNQKENLALDLPIPALMRRALEQSDADARKEMVGNVVLTGGGSLFEGMPERITSELTNSLPSAFKVRKDSSTLVARRFSVWIGGSILCSLGTFQQLWLSKRQYEEQGPDMAESRRFQG
ncbi:unnamed protein product, partial [Scytosiphon promiscuus]